MTEPLRPMTQRIEDLLKERDCWFETFSHGEVLTSLEAAATRPGYSLHQGAKALIVRFKPRGGSKQFALLIMAADMMFDNRKAKEVLNTKDLRFATEAEVREVTSGILPGGVPPFGNLFGLEVYLDQAIMDVDKIVFNAGDRRFSVALRLKDYVNLVNPKPVDITKHS